MTGSNPVSSGEIMVKAVVFDVDNTLVDFNKWKEAAVDAAVMAMIDAGLDLTPEAAKKKIYEIYEAKGIEYQEVFNDFLNQVLGYIDYRILASGIIAYRRAREGALVPYPHVHLALLRLFRMATLLWGVALALRVCGLRSETQHGNVRGARDQYSALRRGLWFYAMLTATAAQDGGDRV